MVFVAVVVKMMVVVARVIGKVTVILGKMKVVVGGVNGIWIVVMSCVWGIIWYENC